MLIVLTPDTPDNSSFAYLNQWINDYDYCHFKISFQTKNKSTELFQYLEKIILQYPSLTTKLVVHINELLIDESIDTLYVLLKKIDGNYNISRFHFSERLLELLFYQQEFQVFHSYNISASLHHINIKEIHNHLFYIFYGPVFPSISKKNYLPKKDINNLKFDLSIISKSIEIPVIAIGGITDKNFYLPLNVGFAGIALRGYLWENEDPNLQFKKFIVQWKAYKNLSC